MVTFASPWFLSLLLLIPILFVVKNLLSKSKNGVLKLSSRTIVSYQMIKKGQLKNRILTFFHFAVIILIIIGLARPRIIQSLQEKSIEVIDIVLVIDISSSMLATDFKPNRLEVVKKTAKNFIEKRDGDRLGILVFAGESFIQCPLTVDHDTKKVPQRDFVLRTTKVKYQMRANSIAQILMNFYHSTSTSTTSLPARSFQHLPLNLKAS